MRFAQSVQYYNSLALGEAFAVVGSDAQGELRVHSGGFAHTPLLTQLQRGFRLRCKLTRKGVQKTAGPSLPQSRLAPLQTGDDASRLRHLLMALGPGFRRFQMGLNLVRSRGMENRSDWILATPAAIFIITGATLLPSVAALRSRTMQNGRCHSTATILR